jgi:hypothetical protein
MNWVAAGLVALVLGTSHYLDWPGEIEAAQDAVAAYKAAKTDQERQQRFEAAVQQLCGENAGWKLLDNNSVQCFTKRGYKTQKVQL